MWFLLVAAIVVILLVFVGDQKKQSKITWGMFRAQLEEGGGNIAEAHAQGWKITGKFKEPPPDPRPTSRTRSSTRSSTQKSPPSSR